MSHTHTHIYFVYDGGKYTYCFYTVCNEYVIVLLNKNRFMVSDECEVQILNVKPELKSEIFTHESALLAKQS